MEKKSYSNDIANAISSFLEEDNWIFSFDEKKGVFKFMLSLKNKIKNINYIINVMEEEYSVYATSSIGADENDEKIMRNMAEFLCRVNYGLRTGNFELDHTDGEISYKVHICCEGIIPTRKMIKKSIYCPASMFERYGSGIVAIIFSDAVPKNAVETCERSNEETAHHSVSHVVSSENGSSTDAMLARLAARFGSSSDESNQDSKHTASDASEIVIHTDLFRKKGGVS
ncbi:MAG: YbjN domain-containing protein [Oscillospiraceae bacterium]|nr:YbjN domain-containing protein [Ruminococcus sp.]MDE6707658.1 YbjN domain-containing protein [Oscillospiraceae bacterium]